MSDGERPSQRLTISDGKDFVAEFDRSLIEFIEVSDQRAVALFEGAIFLVDIETGTLTNATKVRIELWEPPRNESPSPSKLLQKFISKIKD